MGLKMYLADMYAKQATVATTSEQKIEKLTKATSLASYQDSYYLGLATNYMAIANAEAVGGANQSLIQSSLAKAIEEGKKAVEINPNKAANNESLALIYENASFYTRGALDWAEDHYKKVIELDPKNPTPYLRTALINMARANAETDTEEKDYYIGEAIKNYDDAISKKGDLAAAYYGKAIASEKLNMIDDAIVQLQRANLVSSNNLDYRFELGRLYFNRGVSNSTLKQTASKEIAVNEIDPNSEETEGEELSIQPTRTTTTSFIEKNNDLVTAEQFFLSIIQLNPKHANAMYSLAVLYQKTGENDNAKIIVNALLEVLQDDATRNAVREQFKDIF